AEIHRIDLPVLHLGVERASRELEAGLASPAVARPAELIGREHARSPAALRLEREESVPRADVEHGLPGEVSREIERREFLARRSLSGGHDAATQIDRMEPIDASHVARQWFRAFGRG